MALAAAAYTADCMAEHIHIRAKHVYSVDSISALKVGVILFSCQSCYHKLAHTYGQCLCLFTSSLHLAVAGVDVACVCVLDCGVHMRAMAGQLMLLTVAPIQVCVLRFKLPACLTPDCWVCTCSNVCAVLCFVFLL